MAVISGGAGYIGGAIAKKLAKEGFKIAVLYHHTAGDLFLSSKTNSGQRAYQCDLRQEKAVAETINKIVEDHGGAIDVCVHAAETKIRRALLKDLSSAEYKEQFAVGVFGGFNLFSAVARHMKPGSVIIGITSVYTASPAYAPKIGAYIPAKCALHGLLRVLSKELAAENIRVCAVAPSFLPAGMNSDLPPAVAKFIYEKNSGQKPATVEDVAEAVSYLCSPAAAHLTGISLFVSSQEQIPL